MTACTPFGGVRGRLSANMLRAARPATALRPIGDSGLLLGTMFLPKLRARAAEATSRAVQTGDGLPALPASQFMEHRQRQRRGEEAWAPVWEKMSRSGRGLREGLEGEDGEGGL